MSARVPGPMPTGTVRGERIYAVDGPCAVATIDGLTDADGKTLPTSASMLPIGPGRDPRPRDEIAAGLLELMDIMDGVTVDVVFFDSIIEAHDARPDAVTTDRTVASVLKGARVSRELDKQRAEWFAAIEAAGHEVCDRCGGAGGHAGWPGYTCYECGGRGSVAA